MLFLRRRAVDHVVSLVEDGEQFRDFLGRMLEVVVHGDDDGVLGGADSAQQRVVLAVVAHQVDGVNPRVLRSEMSHDVPTVVGTVVVDEDEFVIFGESGQDFAQAADEFGQYAFAAVDRHDYGNSGPVVAGAAARWRVETLRERGHDALSTRDRGDADDDDEQAKEFLRGDFFVQEVERADGDERIRKAPEQRVAGGELLGGKDAEPHEGGDAGEKKSADEGRLAQQGEQGRNGRGESAGVRDAILHEEVGERHAGGRQQDEEKARQGHARRLRKLEFVIVSSSECLLVKGYVITAGGRGTRWWAISRTLIQARAQSF